MVVDIIFVDLSLTSECTNPLNREAAETSTALSLSSKSSPSHKTPTAM